MESKLKNIQPEEIYGEKSESMRFWIFLKTVPNFVPQISFTKHMYNGEKNIYDIQK